MSKTKTFSVAREHYGDKDYATGDTREAPLADVAHLVKAGVLIDDGGKAAKAIQDKRAKAAKNKAAPKGANKAG